MFKKNISLHLWFEALTNLVFGLGAISLVNAFANINTKTKTFREPHKDRFSGSATHRLLGYLVDDGFPSQLMLTVNGEERVISIPSGTGIIVPKAVLNAPHRHTTEHLNFALIVELEFGDALVNTETSMEVHADHSCFDFAPFAEALDSDDPRSVFKASPSRFASFSAPTPRQRLEYLAMAFICAPKGKRRYGEKKAARDIARELPLHELVGLASQHMSEIGKKFNCRLLLDVLCMMFATWSCNASHPSPPCLY